MRLNASERSHRLKRRVTSSRWKCARRFLVRALVISGYLCLSLVIPVNAGTRARETPMRMDGDHSLICDSEKQSSGRGLSGFSQPSRPKDVSVASLSGPIAAFGLTGRRDGRCG